MKHTHVHLYRWGVFQIARTSIHYLEQCVRVLVDPHTHQLLELAMFLF